MESAWMIEEDKDGEAVLTIRNENGPICFLRAGPDGVWRGRWLVYERMRVAVQPTPLAHARGSTGALSRDREGAES